jgi:hypothetical protein
MATDLVERPATDMAPQTILDAIKRPDVDPAQMMGMLDVYERLENARASEQFGYALATFQARCPQITKTRKIDLGGGSGPMYASLDDIMREIAPLLAEFRIAVTFSATLTDDGKMRAVCHVRHGRHVESSEITLAVPAQMRVNDTQKMGAALSYAKRYALCAALNIVVTDEDSDAQGVAQAIDEKQVATLEEWIETSGANRQKFLDTYQIKTLGEMPAQMFLTAISQLQRKAKQK